MGIDLTGANLAGYMLRVTSDVVNRSQRFRQALGDVTVSFNNLIGWQDVQVVIKDIASSPVRLSPDYFMCTKIGRAILIKVEGKDGSFLEWVSETDATRQTPPAGVYYLEVDKVNDETNELILIIHKYTWIEGNSKNAAGSIIYFRPEVTLSSAVLVNKDTNAVLVAGVDYTYFNNSIVLITPVVHIAIAGLTPLADYWYLRSQTITLFPTTTMGAQTAFVPAGVTSFALNDQTGYQLRLGVDYTVSGSSVQLGQWTPSGKTITMTAVMRADPSITSAIHPENNLPIPATTGINLVPGQTVVHTPLGNFTTLSSNGDGTYSIPQLLEPGDWLRWEARIDQGLSKTKVKKRNLNGNAIPGLNLAIGDNVTVGDQCAIIVSPSQTETYYQFGSKDNVSFTLEVKANDLQTASDLGEMLKDAFLIYRRENMEADGITIYECSRSYQGKSRDTSGTSPSYTCTFSYTSGCDWKVFIPLITRITNFEISVTPGFDDFPGKLQLIDGKAAPIAKVFGVTKFLTSYQ